MSLDKAIKHGKEKRNHTEAQRLSTVLAVITALAFGAEITGFINLGKARLNNE